jgi:predicted nuclease with RNAse H fold
VVVLVKVVGMKVVGIDMAGADGRPTGFCILDVLDNESSKASCCVLHTDKEIVAAVRRIKPKPKVVAIDAPLGLPKGRRSIEQRNAIHFRECDRELARMGIKFFPITLGPMRKLTARGIRLKRKLEAKGFKVVETYPGAVQDVLKIPRKQDGLDKLLKGLRKFGVRGLNEGMDGDELDAATCALVGKMYVEGDYAAIGDPAEILMILPKIPSKK